MRTTRTFIVRGAHVFICPQLMAPVLSVGPEFEATSLDPCVVPSSQPKDAWEVRIYRSLWILSWGLSLADWWGSEPHREVEDRPGSPSRPWPPGIPLKPLGFFKDQLGTQRPIRESVGGYDPRAGAILPLQQGALNCSVGGLIPSKSGVQSCLFLFWSFVVGFACFKESSTGYQPKRNSAKSCVL